MYVYIYIYIYIDTYTYIYADSNMLILQKGSYFKSIGFESKYCFLQVAFLGLKPGSNDSFRSVNLAI